MATGTNGRNGCDWCMMCAADCYPAGSPPLACWDHIESGRCAYFAPVAGEWHRRAAATLATAGFTLPRDAGFWHRLGFGLPPRPAQGAGSPPRPSIDATRLTLMDHFFDTFGAWAEENAHALSRCLASKGHAESCSKRGIP